MVNQKNLAESRANHENQGFEELIMGGGMQNPYDHSVLQFSLAWQGGEGFWEIPSQALDLIEV